MPRAGILIVEDDKNVADALRDIFSAQEYAVFTAENNADALDALKAQNVDIAILDISLGTDSGYDLCRSIRRFSDMPILFLTACSSELELIRGFQSGGDDYMTKPFRMQELLLRVQALLRRSSKKDNGIVKSGGLILDAEKRIIKNKDVAVNISGVEWKIVYALVSRYPHTLSRDELLYAVWDKDEAFVEANTLNVNISRLREKLGSFEGRPYIETVRGVGYRWAVMAER